MEQAELRALVDEAMKRTALVWLSFAGSDRAWPVWHVWDGAAAYVVSAGREQRLDGIERAERVVVTARAKDSRERLVSWVAEPVVLEPRSDDWRAAVELLRAERLNATQGDALLDVWAEQSTVTRLTPTGETTERPGAYPDDSLAAAPVESPATTTGKLPWVVHRRAGRAPRL
ncbi:MAG: hypothetical protein ACRDWI_10960 [Jiangellaceae bacterium]